MPTIGCHSLCSEKRSGSDTQYLGLIDQYSFLALLVTHTLGGVVDGTWYSWLIRARGKV